MSNKPETRIFMDKSLDAWVTNQARLSGMTKTKYIIEILQAAKDVVTIDTPQTSTDKMVDGTDRLSTIEERLDRLEQAKAAPGKTQLEVGTIVDGQSSKIYNELSRNPSGKNIIGSRRFYYHRKMGVVYTTDYSLRSKAGKAKYLILDVVDRNIPVNPDGTFGVIVNEDEFDWFSIRNPLT